MQKLEHLHFHMEMLRYFVIIICYHDFMNYFIHYDNKSLLSLLLGLNGKTVDLKEAANIIDNSSDVG